MTPHRGRIVGAILLGLVAFVLGHDLVFLATYGSRYLHGLGQTGHDASWPIVAATAILIALAAAASAALRLGRLSRLARELEGHRIVVVRGRASDLGRRVVDRWLAIAPVAMVAFVVAENVEHVRSGLGAPGLAVLGSAEYTALAPLILGLASLLVALAAALFGWQRDMLASRIAAARRRPAYRRVEPDAPALAIHLVSPRSILGARLAGRAPPLLP